MQANRYLLLLQVNHSLDFKRPFGFAILLLCLFQAGLVMAVDTTFDRSAPIEIEADSAEQNETLGLITYRGNVEISQGNLKISADRVSIKSEKPTDGDSRELKHITATGSPARLVHTASINEDIVQAQAETIFFEIGKSTISLTQNALLKQNNSSVSGDFIEYLIEQRRVKAKALDPESGGRVHTIISPDSTGLLPALK